MVGNCLISSSLIDFFLLRSACFLFHLNFCSGFDICCLKRSDYFVCMWNYYHFIYSWLIQIWMLFLSPLNYYSMNTYGKLLPKQSVQEFIYEFMNFQAIHILEWLTNTNLVESLGILLGVNKINRLLQNEKAPNVAQNSLNSTRLCRNSGGSQVV